MTLPVARTTRDPGRMASGSARDTGRMPAVVPGTARHAGWVTATQGNRDCRLAAAGLGLGHLLLIDGAFVLAELFFELEVRTGRRISNVL